MKRSSLLSCLALLGLCVSFLFHGFALSAGEDLKVVTVAVDQAVLDLVADWDKDIRFFTSAENPIKTFDGLQWTDIACWGVELFKKVKALYKAIGIQETEDTGVRVVGTGAYDSTEQRLFITWAKYGPELAGKGAALVQLTAK